jgi:hypothetical protein
MRTNVLYFIGECKMKKFVLVLLLGITLACANNPFIPTRQRKGAVCKDGTTTTATGESACANNGGVDYWLY